MLIASFDTPVRSGRSRTRTPFSSRTRTTLAPIASDKSDSRSNSMANASSTRESSADSGRPRTDAVFFASGRRPPLLIRPSAEQPIPQDRETVGQLDVNLADQRRQRFPKLGDLVLAEARLPALFDGAEQRPPYLLSPRPFAVARITQRERGGFGRLSAGSGSTTIYPHLSMPFKFVFVRAKFSSSATGTPSSPTNCMQFDHITIDASQGP